MRQKNWRLIAGGLVFMAFAGAFFWVMAGQMARSTDASGMMHEVGQVSGLVGAIGVALLVAGLFGWRGLSKKRDGAG
jgi:vacuolar-type H+-ATPase subunit I/STV1